MNRNKNKKGNIVIALALAFVFALISIAALSLMQNEGQKADFMVNTNRVRLLAEGAMDMAELKIRREMNDIPSGQIQMITGLLKAISNPKGSWFLKFRAPGVMIKGGMTGQTGMTDIDAEASLSFDKLMGGVDWANQTLNANDLGLKPLQDELYGDSQVKVTIKLKHMRPITSADASKQTTLFEGAETDDSKIQNWVKKFGDKIVDFFCDLLPGNGKLDFTKFIKDIKFEFKIYGISIPIPIGNLLAPILGKFLVLDLRGLMEGAFEKFANSLHIGDISAITGEIVLEKMATLEFIVEIDYKHLGHDNYKVKLEATKDIKVVDLMPIQPLYTFFWTGNDSNRDKKWWTKGKHFTLNNFPEGNVFKAIPKLPSVFKEGRLPGMVFIGGKGKNTIPISFFDFLLYLPKYSNYTPVFVNPPGTDNWHHPWLVDRGAGFTFWPPFVPLLPVDPFALITLIKMFKKPNTHLFGKFCFSPPLDLKIHGNVYKMFQRTFVVGIPQIFLVFVYIPPMGIYAYRDVEKPYSYAFFESDLKPEEQVQMENLYPQGQYKTKATSIYQSNEEFHSDKSVFTGGEVLVDGVYYIEGDATISGTVKGAGTIVATGDITARDVKHDWQEADGPSGKKVRKPFNLISFKKIVLAGGSVDATVYGAQGVACSSNTQLNGNLAVKEFDRGAISSDLTVNYDSRRTTPSLLALLPYVGRYIPHRYRVILSRQYSTWKYHTPGGKP